MISEEMQVWINYVKERADDWPKILDDKDHMSHWLGKVYIGRTLFREYKEYDGAYAILREVYVNNEIRHHRDIFGSYEDYIEEKVHFFKEMAELSYIVTKDPAQSVTYIDEALIMLDASESVGPYVDQREFEQLKRDYLQLVKES